jgi:hypothetical protein
VVTRNTHSAAVAKNLFYRYCSEDSHLLQEWISTGRFGFCHDPSNQDAFIFFFADLGFSTELSQNGKRSLSHYIVKEIQQYSHLDASLACRLSSLTFFIRNLENLIHEL